MKNMQANAASEGKGRAFLTPLAAFCEEGVVVFVREKHSCLCALLSLEVILKVQIHGKHDHVALWHLPIWSSAEVPR